MHYDATVGCYLEVSSERGGGIQKLGRVHGHSDRVMRCHPGLNLKVGKMKYGLANWTLALQYVPKDRQNCSRNVLPLEVANLFIAEV